MSWPKDMPDETTAWMGCSPPFHGIATLEPFDIGEFLPGTRGSRGLCSWCDRPAAWMNLVFTRQSESTDTETLGQPVGRIPHAKMTARCDVHGSGYSKAPRPQVAS